MIHPLKDGLRAIGPQHHSFLSFVIRLDVDVRRMDRPTQMEKLGEKLEKRDAH